MVDRVSHEPQPDDEPSSAGSSLDAGLRAAFMLPVSTLPEFVGRFRILGELGRGGMGVVYDAEQAEPRRRVALKVIAGGQASPEALRRFRQEADLLGRLQHPGIAVIHEAGILPETAGGTPYFAMEYVEGDPLDVYVRAGELGPREVSRLIAEIADAVHHAHQKGVLHRDLKPANILVDSQGRARILDFGVARALDDDRVDATMLTRQGQLIGTLPYMAPEQVLGDSRDLDTRVDVYALGVLLYELLAGRLPLHVPTANPHAWIPVIQNRQPELLGRVVKGVGGDLETIAHKALAKEPGARYSSAAALAADLRRVLRNEPIEARPPTRLYALRKFVVRNRVLVAALALVFVGLSIGVALALSAAAGERTARRQEAEARARANERRHEAEVASRSARILALRAEVRAALGRDPMRALILATELGRRDRTLATQSLLRRALAESLERLRMGSLGGTPVRRLVSLADGRFLACFAAPLPDTGSPNTVAAEQGAPVYGHVILADPFTGAIARFGDAHRAVLGADVCASRNTFVLAWAGSLLTGHDRTGRELWRFEGPPTRLSQVAAHPKEELLAVLEGAAGGSRSALHLLASDGTNIRRWELPPGRHELIGWSGDGTQLATHQLTFRVTADADAHLWSAQGKLLHTISGSAGQRGAVNWNDDRSRLLIRRNGGGCVAHDVSSGSTLEFLDSAALAVSGRSGYVVAARSDGLGSRLFDSSGALVSQLTNYPFQQPEEVAFSPSGRHVAVTGFHGRVRLFDLTGALLMETPRGPRATAHVRLGSRGTIWSTCDSTHRLRHWSKEGDLLSAWSGHSGPITTFMTVARDGVRRVVTGSVDGTVRVWAMAAGEFTPVDRRAPDFRLTYVQRARYGEAPFVRLSRGGECVLQQGGRRAILRSSLTAGDDVLAEGPMHDHPVRVMDMNKDGTWMVTVSGVNDLRIWNRHGVTHSVRPTDERVMAVAMSRSGNRIILVHQTQVSAHPGTGLLLDRRGRVLARIENIAANPGRTPVMLADGGWLALVHSEDAVGRWDPSAKRRVTVSTGPGARYVDRNVFVSSDESVFATTSGDHLRVWSSDGTPRWQTQRKEGTIHACAFDSEGKRLAVVGAGGTLQVYNATDGVLIAEAEVDEDHLSTLAWSPDGRRIAACNNATGRRHVVYRWLVEFDDLLALAESHRTRSLRDDERAELAPLLVK